jgi:hypothetical protein
VHFTVQSTTPPVSESSPHAGGEELLYQLFVTLLRGSHQSCLVGQQKTRVPSRRVYSAWDWLIGCVPHVRVLDKQRHVRRQVNVEVVTSLLPSFSCAATLRVFLLSNFS